MPTLKGKEINVYNFDTQKTIKERIAANLKSLPKYIYIQPNITNETGEIEYINLIEKANDYDNILDFYNINTKFFPELTLEDFVKIYMDYNAMLKEDPLYLLDLEVVLQEYSKDKGIYINIDKFKQEQYERMKMVETEIRENIKHVQNFIGTFDKFRETESLDKTPFTIEKILIEYTTNINKSLLDILNNIQCNDKCVYTTHKKFIKVYSNFTIPSFWMTHMDNILLLKVLIDDTMKLDLNENTYENGFADVLFYEEDGKVKMGLRVYVQKEELPILEQKIIRYIKQTLLFDFVTETRELKNISGYFLLPKLKINKFVFADLVMLNKFFKNFLLIDESNKASKKKDVVYFSFDDPTISDSNSSVSISSKFALRNDPDLKGQDKILFLKYKYFTKVKVLRASNAKIIDRIQDILSKLLKIYTEEEDTIIREYREYIPDFAEEEEPQREEPVKKSLKKLKLKDIAPDLFLDNYTRKCDKKPTVIDDNEVDEYTSKGFQIMKFPKTPEEGKQYNYICNYEEEKYPGLRVNNMENKDKYPYLPCCYKIDQTTKNKSYYREYYYGEELEEKGEQQRIISTNKIVELNKFGFLPENLKQVMHVLDTSFKYLRKGSSISTNSFLECVLDIVDKNIFGLKGKARTDYLNVKRKELSTDIQLSYRNNPFNYTKLNDILNNENIYLDPRSFVDVISYKYKINIIMFTRKNEENEVLPLIPNYKYVIQNCNEIYDKSIIVYEHWGNESDKLKYPICELIVQWNPETQQTINSFVSNDFVIQELENVMNKYLSFSTTKTFIKPMNSLPFIIDKCVYDNEGFIQIFSTKFEEKNIVIFSDPIPPCKQYEPLEDKTFTNYDVVLQFMKVYNVYIKSFSRENEKGTIYFEYEGKTFGILTQNIPPVFNHPEVQFLFSGESDLFELDFKRKNAKCLQQYVLYAFSKYVNGDVTKLNEININTFIDENTVVERFIYSEMGDTFDLDTVYSKNGGKLPIFNKNVKSKLKYFLYQLVQFDQSKILSFKDNTFMDNYYQSLGDFMARENNDMYDSFFLYDRIITTTNDFTLYDTVQPEKNEPYYISLKKTYLAVPCISLEQAISVSYNYLTKKQISKENVAYDGGFTEIVYNSMSNIYYYKKEGRLQQNMIVLVYKYKKVKRYLSLIKM
jgi:hypothetical protein